MSAELLSPRAPPSVEGALADSYLSQLLSFSLDTFAKEPQSLRTQQDYLRAEVADTAVAHYAGFIGAASSFADISRHIEAVQQQLGALVGDMQALNAKCESFGATAAQIQVCGPGRLQGV